MKALYKIVHTSSSTCWEDTEKRILDESVWMVGQGHQVVIVAPGKSPLFHKARDNGLPVYALSFRGLARLREYRELTEILANEQPYVINVHGRSDAGIALKAALKTGVPCRIISRHTGARLRNTWQNRHLYKKLSHYVFTSCTHTATTLKQTLKLREMDIFSIPCGIVPPEGLLARSEARKTLATELGLDEDTRFIGVLPPYTRQDLAKVSNALKRIRAQIPHHLVIMETEDRSPTSEWEVSHQELKKRVHFIPPQTQADAWSFYRALDCGILLTNRFKSSPMGFIPRSLPEAMYASCPVIAPESDTIADIITPEKTGLLFDPGTPEQLAEILSHSLTSEAATRERVHRARELVKKDYTIDTMGRDIIRLYRLHQVKLEKQYMPG